MNTRTFKIFLQYSRTRSQSCVALRHAQQLWMRLSLLQIRAMTWHSSDLDACTTSGMVCRKITNWRQRCSSWPLTKAMPTRSANLESCTTKEKVCRTITN